MTNLEWEKKFDEQFGNMLDYDKDHINPIKSFIAQSHKDLIADIQEKLKEMEKPYMGTGNFEDVSYNSALADINLYLKELE